jgi:hypothetical protein
MKYGFLLAVLFGTGVHMKTNFNSKNLIAITIWALSALLLSGCGNTKSTPVVSSSNAFRVGVKKTLANCNKSKDSNFSFNTSSVLDQNGQTSNDWIKMKFNFLSATMTASGNSVKFFKWRVVGTDAQLDNTPLQFAAYDLSSGQTVGSQMTSISVNQLSPSNGLYIQLNDPNVVFQVIKIVVYNSSGQIVGSLNSLIPGFYASPLDYQYNSDGTARSVSLQQMHNLYGTDVSAWTAAQLQQSFDQYCF